MRCPICGTADAACGAAPMEKPVLGERTIGVVNDAGDVVRTATPAEGPGEQGGDPAPVAAADIQVDD